MRRLVITTLALTLFLGGALQARSELSEREQAAADELTDVAINGLITESDVFWHEGDYRRASASQLMGSYLDPTYEDGFDSSSWLIWSLGYDARAIKIYEAGIKANPNSTKLVSGLAFHYYNTKRPAQALDLFWKSLKLVEDAPTYLSIGHCYKAMGYPHLALRQYEKALRLDPTHGPANFNVNLMRERLGFLSRPFSMLTDYLSITTYVQRLTKKLTGEDVSKAEARKIAAELRRGERPLYITRKLQEKAEEANRPPMPPGMKGPMGPGMKGPMGPMGPMQKGPGAPDQVTL